MTDEVADVITRRRMAKAEKIAAQIIIDGPTWVADALLHHDSMWTRRAIERRADVPESSDVTWDMVRMLLVAYVTGRADGLRADDDPSVWTNWTKIYESTTA